MDNFYNHDNHCSIVKCDIITTESSQQLLTALLVLMSFIITGVCLYLLKLFYQSSNHVLYQKSLTARRPIHIFVSYILILSSLLLQTISLMCLYWRPVQPPRNDLEDGINIWTFADGSPIYFTPTIDYILHFIFWALFLSFVHLKVYGLIIQIYELNGGYHSHRHIDTKCKALSTKCGYPFVFLCVGVILVIMLMIRIPNIDDKNASHYEQIPLFLIGFVDLLFLVWHFYMHFDEENDTIYLYTQWKQIRKLLIAGICGWAVLLLIYMMYIGDYLTLKVIIILLYGTWQSLFCYIETKWIMTKLDKERKESALSNNNRVKISMDSLPDDTYIADKDDIIHNVAEDEEDQQVIHDMLVDSIDTADFTEDSEWGHKDEFKRNDGKNKIKLSLIIENRKKEMRKITANGEDMLKLNRIESNENKMKLPQNNKNKLNGDRGMSPISDSEDLYVIDTNNRRLSGKPTRRTPNPPPPKQPGRAYSNAKRNRRNGGRISGVRDFRGDSEAMYYNNHKKDDIETVKETPTDKGNKSNNQDLNIIQRKHEQEPGKRYSHSTSSYITPVIKPTPRGSNSMSHYRLNEYENKSKEKFRRNKGKIAKKVDKMSLEEDIGLKLPDMPVINGDNIQTANDWSSSSEDAEAPSTKGRETVSEQKENIKLIVDDLQELQPEGSASNTEESQKKHNQHPFEPPGVDNKIANNVRFGPRINIEDQWDSDNDSDIYKDDISEFSSKHKRQWMHKQRISVLSTATLTETAEGHDDDDIVDPGDV